MIYLISGFSGAGKSHLLKELSLNPLLTSFKFIDLDERLEENLTLLPGTLGEFIERVGFDEFRALERTELLKIVSKDEDLIIALGGGSLTKKVLFRLDRQNIEIAYLNTPFEICYERIKGDVNRPLAKKSREELERIYRERRELLGDVFTFLNSNEITEHILS